MTRPIEPYDPAAERERGAADAREGRWRLGEKSRDYIEGHMEVDRAKEAAANIARREAGITVAQLVELLGKVPQDAKPWFEIEGIYCYIGGLAVAPGQDVEIVGAENVREAAQYGQQHGRVVFGFDLPPPYVPPPRPEAPPAVSPSGEVLGFLPDAGGDLYHDPPSPPGAFELAGAAPLWTGQHGARVAYVPETEFGVVPGQGPREVRGDREPLGAASVDTVVCGVMEISEDEAKEWAPLSAADATFTFELTEKGVTTRHSGVRPERLPNGGVRFTMNPSTATASWRA